MRILAVSDVEEKVLYDFFRKDRVEGVELIVSCGDLKAGYLDFLMTMVNVPMVYVRGNHDDLLNDEPPMGAVCLEDRVYKYNGYRFAGLGGCFGFNRQCKNNYSEGEMKFRAMRLAPKIAFNRGIDIFVTHAPAKGFGDLEDVPHRGFQTFNDMLNKYKPEYMFHGHVHTNYGRNIVTEMEHPSGTKIINACGYRIIDLPDRK